jgi:hypothetical protein
MLKVWCFFLGPRPPVAIAGSAEALGIVVTVGGQDVVRQIEHAHL